LTYVVVDICLLLTEEMMRQLLLAVELIEQGNSYRRVSTMLHIPKSTIYSYVSKRRDGRDLFSRKNQVKKQLLKTKFKFAKKPAPHSDAVEGPAPHSDAVEGRE
jgi:transposase